MVIKNLVGEKINSIEALFIQQDGAVKVTEGDKDNLYNVRISDTCMYKCEFFGNLSIILSVGSRQVVLDRCDFSTIVIY